MSYFFATVTPVLRIFRNELLKVFFGRCDVELCQGGRYLRTGPGHNHHYVGVASEHIDVCSELGVAHFHSPELRLGLRAADLELLDDVGDALEPVAVVVLRSEKMQRSVKSDPSPEHEVATKLYSRLTPASTCGRLRGKLPSQIAPPRRRHRSY
jgi:hypothetical protein